MRGLLIDRVGAAAILVVRCPQCNKDHGIYVTEVDGWPVDPYKRPTGWNTNAWYVMRDGHHLVVRPSAHFISDCGYHTPFEWRVAIQIVPPGRKRGEKGTMRGLMAVSG